MIYHITTKEEWDKQSKNDLFYSESLKKEGFIYCALKKQILPVLNSKFIGRQDLIVLYIDEKLLKPELIYEDLSNKGEKHPHVYGSINKDAIVKVVDFKPDEDGTFSLPKKFVD